MKPFALPVLLAFLVTAFPAAETPRDAARRTNLDQILDLYVRDGWVYYRALKVERAKLDAYLAEAANAPVQTYGRDEKVAFWLNTYNALVLQTVIDHYPIQGRAADYPAHSIRQIPGAFERLPHRVGGRSVTLDAIEKTILPEFKDPRVYFALGRGAVGSGRLRSEAYNPEALNGQLSAVAAECTSRPECVQVDREGEKLIASPIFSWREPEFSASYAGGAAPIFSTRSPIERAVLAFVQPRLLTTEREALDKNTFRVEFGRFDWSLNDLTGRGGR
jgi:hypothetical protein